MKIKAPLSVAGVALFGVIATGCSSQQATSSAQNVGSAAQNVGSSQQNVDTGTVETTTTTTEVVTPPPANTGNCHNHPENQARGTVRHCHPHPNGPNHTHTYGGGATKTMVNPDVSELQRRLKAKGYYKGPIDGVLNDGTKAALQSYQANR